MMIKHKQIIILQMVLKIKLNGMFTNFNRSVSTYKKCSRYLTSRSITWKLHASSSLHPFEKLLTHSKKRMIPRLPKFQSYCMTSNIYRTCWTCKFNQSMIWSKCSVTESVSTIYSSFSTIRKLMTLTSNLWKKTMKTFWVV